MQRARLNPRTACPDDSIWQAIPEDVFRSHLVLLEERTKAIPIRSAVFSYDQDEFPARSLHKLSHEDEQRIADHFAYLAATSEGAQSVAAVCIEEHRSTAALHLRFAAADAIEDVVKVGLEEVGNILMSCAHSYASSSHNEMESIQHLLEIIVDLHMKKLLGRLRSVKWIKPPYLSRTHKKPLWQDFDNLLHRLQHIYPKQKNPRRQRLEQQLKDLQLVLKGFEVIESAPEAESGKMMALVRSCYTTCQSIDLADYVSKLEGIPKPTAQVAAALKTVHQIEKIGAYYNIAIRLVKQAKTHTRLFRTISFEYLEPYDAIPTDIGFESWAKIMHVHAEVQLVVSYDTQTTQAETDGLYPWLPPRSIGTSKYLCYLCYLFIKNHGIFHAANTHGRLYDQWTIPDLAIFNEGTRRKYTSMISSIDAEVRNKIEEVGRRSGKREVWRVEPMTSRQNLIGNLQDGSEIELHHSLDQLHLSPP